MPKKAIISASIMGLGMHPGAWMARNGQASDYLSPDIYAGVARTAERGKLHAIFFADALTNAEEGTDRPSLGALDPSIVLATMAHATSRIGLVGTASTTYAEPYDLARRFATLDHLTRGRVGWNAVATFIPAVAAMFGGRTLPSRDSRYERADEFIEVVFKLWDSWQEGALIGDKANGVFADTDEAGHAFQSQAGRVFRSEAGHPWRHSHGSRG